VQHATLRPASPDDTAALRFSVEDALNTMDFADCGRLVIVRKLRLHGLPPRPTPAEVSRRLEAAWRELARQAWPAEHPQADQAPAVFFASRAQARLGWLRAEAHQAPISAWFWPQALPELRHAASPEQAVERVAWAVLEEAAEAFIESLRHWPDAVLQRWAGRVSPRVAQALLSRLVVEPAASYDSALRSAASSSASPTPASQSPRVLQQAQRLRARIDVRPASGDIRWLVAQRLSDGGPQPTLAEVESVQHHLIDSEAPEVPCELPRPVSVEVSKASADRSAVSPRAPFEAAQAAPHTEPPTWPADAPEQAADRPQQAAPAPAIAGVVQDAGPAPARAQRMRLPIASAALPWLVDAQASECGGLLCLTHVLNRLGLDAWLAQQTPEARRLWGRQFLCAVLDRIDPTERDPQRAWLALSAQEQQAWATTRCTPPSWAGTGANLDAPTASRLWLLQARRVLSRRAQLSLRDLVQRRAWLSLTPTHIDIVMAVDDADLRLRRVGLDVDPGWVPWLGRIVGFHFVDKAQLPPWPFEPHTSDSHG
jgi:hypothetical protein